MKRVERENTCTALGVAQIGPKESGRDIIIISTSSDGLEDTGVISCGTC